MRTTLLATVAFAALGLASMPAHATFVAEDCSHSKCPAETKFYNDSANKNVSLFTGQVGQPTGPSVTVNTIGNVDTGAGYSNIVPTKGGVLTELTFTPADDTLFEDFSFRGQIAVGNSLPATIDATWTDAQGNTGMVPFSVDVTFPSDFGRLGIISHDGETLKSVVIDLASPGFKEFKQVDFSFASDNGGGGGSVPEPTTIALLGVGLLGLGLVKRRSRLKN
jgi:hypothetical protein